MKYIVLNVKHNFQHKKVVNFFFLYFVSKCLLLMIQNISIEKKIKILCIKNNIQLNSFMNLEITFDVSK